ncbi:transketolase [Eubacterium minutum ATCC 700079]|nr:transketolase [Eubacterium minutum ATCC 700079]
MKREKIEYYEEIARRIRIDIIKAVYNAGSGHPGGSLSAADLITALYFGEMNVDPRNPKMEGRDKFVLSKGHAVPAQYAALGERGYFPVEEMMSLRKLGSPFQGHGNCHKVAGIEMSTGSLGQGVSVAVGMALANRLDRSKGRIYVLLGDGELQEGIVWEACMSAGHYKLDNLCVIVDWNGLQIDGKNDDVMRVAPIADKFRAFGFHTVETDGHDFARIFDAFDEAGGVKGSPSAIIARTVKGKGVSFMEDQAGWHGKAPNEEQAREAVEELGGEW